MDQMTNMNEWGQLSKASTKQDSEGKGTSVDSEEDGRNEAGTGCEPSPWAEEQDNKLSIIQYIPNRPIFQSNNWLLLLTKTN